MWLRLGGGRSFGDKACVPPSHTLGNVLACYDGGSEEAARTWVWGMAGLGSWENDPGTPLYPARMAVKDRSCTIGCGLLNWENPCNARDYRRHRAIGQDLVRPMFILALPYQIHDVLELCALRQPIVYLPSQCADLAGWMEACRAV